MNYGERSDWQMGFVAVYGSTLSDSQCQQVAEYFCQQFDISPNWPAGWDQFQVSSTADTCAAVPCPANSDGDGAGGTCTCIDDYEGNIVWNATANAYTGECLAMCLESLTVPYTVGADNGQYLPAHDAVEWC